MQGAHCYRPTARCSSSTGASGCAPCTRPRSSRTYCERRRQTQRPQVRFVEMLQPRTCPRGRQAIIRRWRRCLEPCSNLRASLGARGVRGRGRVSCALTWVFALLYSATVNATYRRCTRPAQQEHARGARRGARVASAAVGRRESAHAPHAFLRPYAASVLGSAPGGPRSRGC
jgi:hypothetical protein